ncbi:hypothetical protein SCH4B_0535 [Ruegeria sp. TrichCH4B]|nr:hypothetical protein SCH4B_0535 [Ruegeria sp. TrichCH4B]
MRVILWRTLNRFVVIEMNKAAALMTGGRFETSVVSASLEQV